MSVQILLSTYNGELYLRPLMESVLGQDYPRVSILVRDDGSIDTTPTLLREFATGSQNIAVVWGDHVGFVQSFFTLIALASPTAEYFALCDQDDVWQRDKLSRAVEFLSRCPSDVPALYCSRVAVVDKNLMPLRYSEIPKKPLSFRNALVENQVRGCTTVFNQAARRLLAQVPSSCISHDWWIYLAISAFGSVVFDSQSRILYRLHASNVFGISTGWIDTWRMKVRQFLENGTNRLMVHQAEEFKRIFGSSLSHEHRHIIERFLDSRRKFWSRLAYALSCDVYRQSTLDQCLLKAKIVLDRL